MFHFIFIFPLFFFINYPLLLPIIIKPLFSFLINPLEFFYKPQTSFKAVYYHVKLLKIFSHIINNLIISF